MTGLVSGLMSANLNTLLRSKGGLIFLLLTIAILLLIRFAALEIDIGPHFVARNEFKNAADAAALAGARVLFNAPP